MARKCPVPPTSETSRPAAVMPSLLGSSHGKAGSALVRHCHRIQQGTPMRQVQFGDEAFNAAYRVAFRDHFLAHTPPSRREDFALVRFGSTAAAPVAPNDEDFAPALPWDAVAAPRCCAATSVRRNQRRGNRVRNRAVIRNHKDVNSPLDFTARCAPSRSYRPPSPADLHH